MARFVNYYCCQNIRKYTLNDTLGAPASPYSNQEYFIPLRNKSVLLPYPTHNLFSNLVVRFVNYDCCQNIRKYTPNHTLKAPHPCSPAGYSAPFFIQDVLAADLFWREHFRISPLYRKCTPKAPFYTITVCRLQQPCYRNINSFLLVSAAISIRFVPFCPILSYLDWRWIVYITILIYFHRTTNTVIYYCILLL